MRTVMRTFPGEEYYQQHPTIMKKVPGFIGTRYVLAVKDLSVSVAFYQSELGFKSLWTDSGWHALRRGACTIMLGECPDEPAAAELGDHAYFAYVEVENIDALYAELGGKAVEVIRPIQDQPWGQREFPIRTVDGHRIMFGEAV